jgi:hypothetical protein
MGCNVVDCIFTFEEFDCNFDELFTGGGSGFSLAMATGAESGVRWGFLACPDRFPTGVPGGGGGGEYSLWKDELESEFSTSKFRGLTTRSTPGD